MTVVRLLVIAFFAIAPVAMNLLAGCLASASLSTDASLMIALVAIIGGGLLVCLGMQIAYYDGHRVGVRRSCDRKLCGLE
ncbi:hypothetical protein [Microvirga terricola]|uniref:Uncharacterized protein n=1 Tax=Microvirga terricola TaxID=2719797 RepID=A0ABX0V6I2_9HYPH|nr:hypothetical protein [Microvirga terricola]NIX75419.1 hypothetical protein [Microvirga terricola]